MKHRKMCVYAICKNESKFVNRFMDAVEKEIDPKDVYILDTGSTDDTVDLFKKRGVNIDVKNYDKFYFDVARNDSLEMIPKDKGYEVYICLDLDDVIQPGFVEQIDKLWEDDTKQLQYDYLYLVDEKDNPIVVFKNGHIHSKDNWTWVNPIHEVLHYQSNDYKTVISEELKIIHRPDPYKSREFYLDLLEEHIAKNPTDTRNLYLLAREYVNRGKYQQCLETSHQYLNCYVTYNPEICKVMCYLARSYRGLKWYEESVYWANRAIETYPNLRDGFFEKMAAYYYADKFNEAIEAGNQALELTEPDGQIYSDSSGWDGSIYDYLSLCYYRIGDYENAIKMVDLDIEQNPNIQRLKDNRDLYVKALEQQKEEKKYSQEQIAARTENQDIRAMLAKIARNKREREKNKEKDKKEDKEKK